MITATTVCDYPNYYIDKYIYSADISDTGEEFTAYEVYTNDGNLLEAFDELEEAIDYVNNQIAWDRLIATLPPHEAIERY